MDLQMIVALAIVGLCGGYVAWKYIGMLINPAKGACHCADCPAAASAPCRQPECTPGNSAAPAASDLRRELEV